MRDSSFAIRTYIAMIALTIGIGLGASRGCNMAFNNRTVDKPAYTMVSRAKGLSGHVEYIKYKGSNAQDLKVYPNFGHRSFSSKLYQDLDGDNLVDRIRINGPEWKGNRLGKLLVRDVDYETHKSDFDKADQKLMEAIQKYQK